VVCSRSVFGSTIRLFAGEFGKFGVDTTFVSQTEPDEWRRALRPNTRLLFAESPTNPLTEICDIRALSAIAQDAGAADAAVLEFELLATADAAHRTLGMDEGLCSKVAAVQAGPQVGAPDSWPIAEQHGSIVDANCVGKNLGPHAGAGLARNAASQPLIEFRLSLRRPRRRGAVRCADDHEGHTCNQ